MGKVKIKKTREEKLAQARLHKKKIYEEIRNDPERYAVFKEKERLRYLKRKEQNKLKNINNLTPRQQRLQRKKWRENRQRYLEKKKKETTILQMLINNSPPTSDEEAEVDFLKQRTTKKYEIDPLEGPSSVMKDDNKLKGNEVCDNCTKKDRQIRRLRYNHSKQIGLLKKEVEKEKKEKAAMKKLLQKVTKNIKSPSTDQKIESLIDNIDPGKKAEVKKKLLFGECIAKQLQEGYKILKKKDKRNFSDTLLKDKDSLKKYKLLTTVKSFTVRNKKDVDKIKEIDVKQDIEDFFEDDSNSKISADKKEYIKQNRITKQKRYLSDTLINLNKKFNDMHAYKINYTTFCRNRPFWVVYPKNSDRNTCLCMTHVNFDLLLKVLQINKIITESNGSSLLESLCCDVRNEQCLNRICKICNTKFIKYEEFRNEKPLKYYQWGAKIVKYTVKGEEKITKKTTKIEMHDLPLTLVHKLEDSLPKYFKHCLNIVQQYNNINNLKKSLTPKEVLIHMDFSENYISKFHQEVQSHHFGNSPEQISLHTSVAYLLDSETGVHKTYSMCTMSECTRHDAEAVWAHIIPIIEFVISITFIDTLHFVTDSPSSQYRNRKIFYIISQLQQTFPNLKTITWNYLESGHGKGAPDGIGAVVKRTADRMVRFGRDVGSIKDFSVVMKANIKNVEFRMVTMKDIEEKKVSPKVRNFKGTMAVHQVLWSITSLRMTFRKLSCFFCPNGIKCTHGYHLGFLDLPEDCHQEQQQLLQDFLDQNTTPELIDEITNSPKNTCTTLQKLDQSLQQGKPKTFLKFDSLPEVTPKPTSSSRVTILSNIRVNWSNNGFRRKSTTATFESPSFQTDFENFITIENNKKDKESTSAETCQIKPSKKELAMRKNKFMEEFGDKKGDKENVFESDDDEDYKIF